MKEEKLEPQQELEVCYNDFKFLGLLLLTQINYNPNVNK